MTHLNLNTASREQLRQLPGIGPALVERIMEARPYRSVRELIRVNGIGPKLYARWLPLLTVEEGIGEEPSAVSHQPSAVNETMAEPVVEETPAPAEPSVISVQPSAVNETMAEPVVEETPVPVLAETVAPIVPPPAPKPAPPPLPPASLVDSKGKPLLKQGIYANPRRAATYGLSYRQRRQMALAGFYGVFCLLLVGLGGLMYAWWQSTSAQTAAGPSATRPVMVAVVSNTPRPTVLTPAIVATSSTATSVALSPSATQAASATTAPSNTAVPPTTTPLPPSETPTNTATPPPTHTPPPTVTVTPAPTNTPAPTATPTLPPPADAGALLVHENFEPPQFYWGVGNTSFSHTGIKDGQLEINVVRSALAYVVGAMDPQSNFVYQATARPGPCDTGDHYGLRLRAPDDPNYYIFGVLCEGGVRVGRLLNGQYTLLASEALNPAVKIGPEAVNVLRVSAIGDEFKFYANDELLVMVRDASLTRGKFGVYAKSTRTAEFTVRFDDVLIWEAQP